MNLFKQTIIFALALIISAGLYASSGKILFSFGKVEIKHADGQFIDAQKNIQLLSGDTIITGVNGRVQLMMNDESVFDLKPNTEFLIEEFRYSTPVVLNTNLNDDKSFYRLMRGGFRTISGLIGKRNKKNYRVTTPVATIGIRGTQFTADLCLDNCPNQDNGLYVSVSNGGVILSNDTGQLSIDAGSSGFVGTNNSPPLHTGQSSSANLTSSAVGIVSSADEDNFQSSIYIPTTVQSDDGSVVNIDSGENITLSGDTTDSLGRGLLVTNGLIESSAQNEIRYIVNENNELEEIAFDSTNYLRGTSSVVNSGVDPSTGLYWGRWADGNAVVVTGTETSEIDLNSSNAHWIYTDNAVTPVVPLSGTANFRLKANTNPTDNLGNTGTLGNASLSADFTNQTVDADVQLEINQESWDASANDVALDGDAATFSGDFDSVTITDSSNTVTDGSGTLDGFFTGDADGDINGAGMAYSLSDDVDTTVEGVVAFEAEPSP